MATSATVTLPTLAAIPWLRYCVTTRDDARPLGGDMSFSTGAADPQGIIENRMHALASIGRTPDQAVMSGLVHRTTVRSVGWDDAGRGALTPTTVIPQTDGLLTDESGLALMMCFADCVPLIVVDTERRVIALAHAGWRGTLAGMAGSVVTAMRERHGSVPKNLTALIGPSIGPRVYVVGPEIVSAFTDAYPTDDLISRHDNGVNLNLWEANAAQFRR
ncbi:MAG: polyphenol oxidase family protein, partial [Chloroflexota bacterium]|nr:polyphenol oxidase family protein [Chloroflexota bacterium]